MFLKSPKKEEGSALVGAILLVLVVAIISATLLSINLNGITQTSTYEYSDKASRNSSSGLDAALIALKKDPCNTVSPMSQNSSQESLGIYYTVYFDFAGDGNDCLTASEIDLTSIGYDSSLKNAQSTQNAIYEYTPADTGSDGEAITSAVFNASQSVSVSNFTLNSGDMVIRKGNFSCTGTTNIAGSVYVLSSTATVQLSNGCSIGGTLYTNGSVTNFTGSGTRVSGDVYSLGTSRYTMSTSAYVGGNVYTNATLNLSSSATVNGSIYSTKSYNGTDWWNTGSQISGATVNGSVYLASSFYLQGSKIFGNITTSSNGGDYIYGSTIQGSLRVGGYFGPNYLQSSTIAGNLTASSTTLSYIAPDSNVGGKITLAGNYTTWGTVKAGGGITVNSPNTPPSDPKITVPIELDTTQPRNTWVDYDFVPEVWTKAGWTIVTATTSQCDYQNNSSLVTALKNLTVKTVIDTRKCSSLNLYGVSVKLKTSVAFVMTAAETSGSNFQQMRWSSADGQPHEFDIIVPDPTVNNEPTCSSNSTLNVYGTNIDSPIAGFVYTPCSLSFGSTSGIIWRGQLYYGGTNTFSIVGGSPHIDYVQVQIPGLYMIDGTGGNANDPGSINSGIGSIGKLVYRRRI